MSQFLTALGRRCCVVNLDFANDNVPYEAAVDVRDLCSLESVMEEFKLGPNGGLVYCMEYLLENAEWLEERLAALDTSYIIFDFPGQVELYTHHDCVSDLLAKLTHRRGLDCRLCSVRTCPLHTFNAHACTCIRPSSDPSPLTTTCPVSCRCTLWTRTTAATQQSLSAPCCSWQAVCSSLVCRT